VKGVTIRGIPREVEETIRKEAKQKGLSVNKVVISLLEKATGQRVATRKTRYHDLDHFSGVWKEAEEKTFIKNLAAQRQIDEELWKKQR
jgi:hypothetical protein